MQQLYMQMQGHFNMKISCLMPTYNRFPKDGWLVEEAVQSFMDQDYENKELLILNDTKDQFLIINRNDKVKIINTDLRFPNLGAKIKYLISKSSGDAFCRWDDDDLSLPHRLSFSVQRLGEDKLEWHPLNYWYKPSIKMPAKEVHKAGNSHLMAMFRREIFDYIDYPNDCCGAEDQAFNQRIAAIGVNNQDILKPEEMFYIYRWGTDSIHLSGQRNMQEHWDAIGNMPIEKGTYIINPRTINYELQISG